MKDSFVVVKLVAEKLIRLIFFSSVNLSKGDAYLVKDGKEKAKLTLVKQTGMPSISIFDYSLKDKLELGHSYFVSINQLGLLPLDINEASTFPGFDEEFYYGGDDLGAIYSPKQTSFALWAPLASKVIIRIRKNAEEPYLLREMTRSPKGVYRHIEKGDIDGYLYSFLVTNSEVERECVDPYAKGSTANMEESAVINPDKHFHAEDDGSALPILQSPTECIVYEGHVRDLTIDKNTDIKHKGKYLGLAEKGRKTIGGHPAGLDHLKKIGITHLQLQPIYDYATVDERHPDDSYNWGYDPGQYFVPEGSYCTNPDDPNCRIDELITLIDTLHAEGIRISMDVVFSHVYQGEYSNFEKLVPNYYFRKKSNGLPTSHSGCGNDLYTSRMMVRKLIVDACKWWVSFYHIDAFRFDLMGLVDVETLNQIKDYVKKKDPFFLLYGEGWNMGLSEEEGPLGRMDHPDLLPDYGFFNDFYRDKVRLFALGEAWVSNDFKNAYLGSCTSFLGSPKFLNATQSVNYIECHDDMCLFDFFMSKVNDKKKALQMVKLANGIVALSFGIAFFHEGQEIGKTKKMNHNTYNAGDCYNAFPYALLDERYEMVEYLVELLKFRKANRFLATSDKSVLEEHVVVLEEDGLISISCDRDDLTSPYEKLTFLINPYEKAINYPNRENLKIFFPSKITPPSNKKGEISVPPKSLLLLSK